MDTEKEQWLRAKALYVQVLGLGFDSPHRADALYSLGWIEYRLGNRVQSRNQFDCFAEQFPSDPRVGEARALALICRAEDALTQGQHLARQQDFELLTSAALRLEEVILLVDRNIPRIQNHAYRTILQDLALQAGLTLLPQLEEYREYQRSDFLYSQIRRVLGYANTDLALCEMMSQIIVHHARAAQSGEGEEDRKERAKFLLLKMTQELSSLVGRGKMEESEAQMEPELKTLLPNIGRQTGRAFCSHPREC